MQISFIATLLLLASTAQAAENTTTLAPNGIVRVDIVKYKKGLFSQCSRNAPEPSDQVWAPNRTEINQFVRGLEDEIVKLRAAKEPAPPQMKYFRQYFGFTKNGERFIYGNFFPERVAKQYPTPGQLIFVCDGGPVFWGIVYSLKTKKFEAPAFNGAV